MSSPAPVAPAPASGISPSVYHLGMPFSIPVTVTLASGQLGLISTFKIDNDSDFDLWRLTASSILSNGAAGLFAVNIFDNHNNRPFTQNNAFVNGENWFGTGALPHDYPAPWRLFRQASVTCTFNERSVPGGGVTNTVQLIFEGYKVDL